MDLTKEQLAKAKEAKSLEELNALAKARGVEITPEELEKFWNSLHSEGELADEELDNVSGGCGPAVYHEAPYIYSSNPRCPYCDSKLEYIEGGQYEVTWEDKKYMCDEFRCPGTTYGCLSHGRGETFIHIWEGDRWLNKYSG